MTVCIKSLKYICSRTFNNSPKLEPRNPNAHQQSRGRTSSPRGVFYSSEDARAGHGSCLTPGTGPGTVRVKGAGSRRCAPPAARTRSRDSSAVGEPGAGGDQKGERGPPGPARARLSLRAPGARPGCAGRLSCAPRPCMLFHPRVAHQGGVSSACVQGKSSRLDGHSQDVGHQ